VGRQKRITNAQAHTNKQELYTSRWKSVLDLKKGRADCKRNNNRREDDKDIRGEEEKTTNLWPSCRSRNRRQVPSPWLCRALHKKKECLEGRKRKTQRPRGIAPPQTRSRAEARACSLFLTTMQRTCTHSLQGLGFMMPLIQESINPCNLVIVYTTDIIHPGMLYAIQGITHPWSCDPHNLFLIILPQVIHGQAHSPTATYHPSTNHQAGTLLPHVAYQPPQIIYGSGTLLPLVSFSSIHKSSMVRAPLFYLFLSSIHKSSTVQAPSFHPLLIIIHKSSNGSGTLVFCLFLIIHPRVIDGSRTLVPSILVVCSSSIHFTLSLLPLLPSPSFLRFSVFQEQTGQTHTRSRKNWVLEQPALMGQNNGRFINTF